MVLFTEADDVAIPVDAEEVDSAYLDVGTEATLMWDWWYALLLDTWAAKPRDRPKFQELQADLFKEFEKYALFLGCLFLRGTDFGPQRQHLHLFFGTRCASHCPSSPTFFFFACVPGVAGKAPDCHPCEILAMLAIWHWKNERVLLPRVTHVREVSQCRLLPV